MSAAMCLRSHVLERDCSVASTNYDITGSYQKDERETDNHCSVEELHALLLRLVLNLLWKESQSNFHVMLAK